MKENFDESTALENLKHRNKMYEIMLQQRMDQKTEQVKAENANKLEKRKGRNMIVGTVVKVVAGGLVWFGLTCLADHIEVPRRNVPRDR